MDSWKRLEFESTNEARIALVEELMLWEGYGCVFYPMISRTEKDDPFPNDVILGINYKIKGGELFPFLFLFLLYINDIA